ncbi:MAG: ATP synthase F1 subunit epsilon [Campylobacterota bacterium]|nr:ATP synthase F1 subunit epsilon [Campylobacterota bacterium]
MDTIKLSIVTPNGEIFNNDIKSVTLPGKEGEFGVLPNHASLVSSLTVGVIEIEKKDAKKEAIAINWGHVKVSEESVDILVDGAVALSTNDKGSDISEKLEQAKNLVNSVQDSNVSMATVEARINSFA